MYLYTSLIIFIFPESQVPQDPQPQPLKRRREAAPPPPPRRPAARRREGAANRRRRRPVASPQRSLQRSRRCWRTSKRRSGEAYLSLF